jgi:hypothetical protein
MGKSLVKAWEGLLALLCNEHMGVYGSGKAVALSKICKAFF